MKKLTVLCVDDNFDNNDLLKFLFEREEYQVTICSTGEECLKCISDHQFSAVVLDYHLPDQDGLEVFREIKKLYPQTPVIIFTADVRDSSREAALEAGVDAYLIKPDDLENIISVVTKLVEAGGLYENAFNR